MLCAAWWSRLTCGHWGAGVGGRHPELPPVSARTRCVSVFSSDSLFSTAIEKPIATPVATTAADPRPMTVIHFVRELVDLLLSSVLAGLVQPTDSADEDDTSGTR